jgi:purine-binding chemotaxis protein CheW
VSASNKALIFAVDELRCAIQLDALERVTRVVYVTPLPGAPPVVAGVINFAGEWVPVVNLRKRLGLPDRPVHLTDAFVITRSESRLIALLVDAVVGITEIAAEESFPDQSMLGNAPFKGAAQSNSGPVLIYDLKSFLSIEDQASLDELSPA